MFEIELTICRKMDLALNNLHRLICHKTQPTFFWNLALRHVSFFFFVRTPLGVPHFCLTSCASWICCFRLNLFEHPRLHRWLKHWVWWCYEPGRIACCRSLRGSFHIYHYENCSRRGSIVLRLSLDVPTTILGCIFFSMLLRDF